MQAPFVVVDSYLVELVEKVDALQREISELKKHDCEFCSP